MTKVQLISTKPSLAFYGELSGGTLVNFTHNGQDCEILFPRKGLTPGEIENLLDDLSDYELSESVCPSPEYLREHSYVDDLNLIFGGNVS